MHCVWKIKQVYQLDILRVYCT